MYQNASNISKLNLPLDYGWCHNSFEAIALLHNTVLFESNPALLKSIKHQIDSKCQDLKSRGKLQHFNFT